MALSEKALLNDRFTREFDRANTLLTISSLCLHKCSVAIVDVNKFVKNCDDIADILIKYNKKDRLLSLYLWARNKLTILYLKGNTGVGVKINCTASTDIIDIKIKELCKAISNNKVIPLLKNLHQDKAYAQPTINN